MNSNTLMGGYDTSKLYRDTDLILGSELYHDTDTWCNHQNVSWYWYVL